VLRMEGQEEEALLLYWDIVEYSAVSGSKLLFLEVVVRRVKGTNPMIRWIVLRPVGNLSTARTPQGL